MSTIQTDRILAKLDEHFAKKDYSGAERHLKYWLDEAVALNDLRAKLLVCNELVGLSRRTGNKQQAYLYADTALLTLKALDAEDNVGAGTTYINIATSYKAFDNAKASLPLFIKAEKIYSDKLEATDSRLGALYNNMALTYAELKSFDEAYRYFEQAIHIMQAAERGELEAAITYLNIASTLEIEHGLLDAEDEISKKLDIAEELLDKYADADDGYYAFVCEKCASVFGYYGRFVYERILKERAKRIYERT